MDLKRGSAARIRAKGGINMDQQLFSTTQSNQPKKGCCQQGQTTRMCLTCLPSYIFQSFRLEIIDAQPPSRKISCNSWPVLAAVALADLQLLLYSVGELMVHVWIHFEGSKTSQDNEATHARTQSEEAK